MFYGFWIEKKCMFMILNRVGLMKYVCVIVMIIIEMLGWNILGI